MRLILETLTPVHIGSGETVEPYEYVITDKFYRINLGKFITSLEKEDKEAFLKLSTAEGFRKFIKQKVNLPKVTEYSMEAHSEVHEIYNNKINDPNNQLSIQTFMKSLNRNRPFIPGSSVKGSIRTAMLFSMADKPINESQNIEKTYFKFKNPQDDPFRVLKISDSQPINLDDMIIYMVKNYTKKAKFKPSGYNMLIESTNSYYTDKMVNIFHDINIDEELKKYNNFIDIDIDNIMSSCNEFYTNVIENELNFYESSENSYAYDRYEMLKKDIGNENSFIMRIGWGSGYDSVTINLARKSPNKKISRRLIRKEFPIGWVRAKILDED